MQDRLADIFKHFTFRARVFQTGLLCDSATFDGTNGLGHVHVLQQGALHIKSSHHPDIVVDEPCVFFYFNAVNHTLLPQGDSVEMLCASIDFGSSYNNPLCTAIPEMVLIKLSETRMLADTLELLFQEAENHHCGKQVVLDRMVEIVIVQILRILMDQGKMKFGLFAGLADPKISKAITALHAEPDSGWTLESLASKAGMSRSHFASSFLETVGVTPGNYITGWRINLAQSLMRKGKSLQFISDAVGYSNTSALTRAFKSRLGLTPREWLTQNK